MKSYIKLYGPPLGKAINALRKVAIGSPEVCVMDYALEASLDLGSIAGPGGEGSYNIVDTVMSFFGGDISKERCNTIISKSGESVGKYDFYFEWFKKPSIKQIEDLISKIDEALVSIGVRYTITTN